MKVLIDGYAPYFHNRKFLLAVLFSLLLVFASAVVQFYAGTFATEKESNPVTDIILNNTRVFDVDGIFIYGTFIFWGLMIFLWLWRPHRIPFSLKAIALFVLIRSAFISLTHIGPFPEHIVINSNVLSRFVFGGDLFFSGHTGIPFLMALIFWDDRYLRLLFIAASIIFGAIVLLAHLHYSIDVFAAFFITYSIYHLALRLFKKDWQVFHRGLPAFQE